MKKIIFILLFTNLLFAQATFEELQTFQNKIKQYTDKGKFDEAYSLLYSKTNNVDYADTCLRNLYFLKLRKIFYKTPAEKEAIKKRNQKSKENFEKLDRNLKKLTKANKKTLREITNLQNNQILVLKNKFYRDKNNVCVEGIIQNVSNQTFDYLKAEVWFLDKNDKPIQKKYVFVDPPTLKPNQKAKYKIIGYYSPKIKDSLLNFVSDGKILKNQKR